MNWFKINKYLQELIEVFCVVVYCLMEVTAMLVGGLFIAGVVTYYAWYGEWDEIKVAQIMYFALAVYGFLSYKVFTVLLKKFLAYMKDTAIWIAMIGHFAIIATVCDFYYGNVINTFEILYIIGIAIIYYYFAVDCKRKIRSRMLEVG